MKHDIITRPHITEKSTALSAQNAYVFEVAPRATKNEIAKAVESIYGVKPVRVNVTKIPAKYVLVRGRPGHKPGGKKAIVYLKEGDKIENI
ncbi:MAG: 50S ribosomal protein L23 [Candidatus Lloydbacteria bacterium CG22_combo_CG10-13_8_21_14_all_47_15]|uniref:Large ribosomal subunit protein uL23 n=1 Tax=Candidatus Lloydbacteria bacterium CG22_combo_CG10-13_8_21_14_all_47_15 TaxID=1974635 RepID=A0A2H0CTB0_9BACT|nr:MAG: 50S ribosomal protein L23 [Candidatus Lloydbacteria bacterium CG22_combo_CG10-13_8_21_14_all_47_15]